VALRNLPNVRNLPGADRPNAVCSDWCPRHEEQWPFLAIFGIMSTYPMHSVEANGDSMTKIQIELPDATAEAAQAAGLLTSEALDRLLSTALRRRQAADWLLSIADEVVAAEVPPMSETEIQAEVKAARKALRHRAADN
jgi:hypothetical protein